jgi:hypothetical protein
LGQDFFPDCAALGSLALPAGKPHYFIGMVLLEGQTSAKAEDHNAIQMFSAPFIDQQSL